MFNYFILLISPSEHLCKHFFPFYKIFLYFIMPKINILLKVKIEVYVLSYSYSFLWYIQINYASYDI